MEDQLIEKALRAEKEKKYFLAYKLIDEYHDRHNSFTNWTTLYYQGKIALRCGYIHVAIEKFEASISIQEDWVTYRYLAGIYYISQNYEMSIENAKKSLALKDSKRTCEILISAFQNSRCWDRIFSCKKVAEECRTINSYKLLAESYRNSGDEINAAKSYSKALLLGDDSDILQRAYNTYYSQGLYKQCIGLAAKACTLIASFKHQKMLYDALKRHSRINKKILVSALLERKKQLLHLQHHEDATGPTIMSMIREEIIYNKFIDVNLIRLISLFSQDEGTPKKWKSCVEKHDYVETVDQWEKTFFNKNIVVFGISHSWLFNGIPNVTTVGAPGGTAFSISNPKSRSGSYNKVMKTIGVTSPANNILAFEFGEVDLREHIHRQSRYNNTSPELVLKEVVNRYIDFLKLMVSQGFELILIGPHAAGGNSFEAGTSVAEEERNSMCLLMNILLRRQAKKIGIKFTSLYNYAIDLENFKIRTQLFSDNYHLHKPPHKTGYENQAVLMKRILSCYQDRNNKSVKFERDLIDIKTRLIASNAVIERVNHSKIYLTNSSSKCDSGNSSKYVAFLLKPIASIDISTMKLNLFIQLESLEIDGIKVVAIGESSDPSKTPNMNTYQGTCFFSQAVSNEATLSYYFESGSESLRCYYVYLEVCRKLNISALSCVCRFGEESMAM